MKKQQYTIDDVKNACKDFKAKYKGDFALNVRVSGYEYETEHFSSVTELVKAIRHYTKSHKIDYISIYDQAFEQILDVWMEFNNH